MHTPTTPEVRSDTPEMEIFSHFEKHVRNNEAIMIIVAVVILPLFFFCFFSPLDGGPALRIFCRVSIGGSVLVRPATLTVLSLAHFTWRSESGELTLVMSPTVRLNTLDTPDEENRVGESSAGKKKRRMREKRR